MRDFGSRGVTAAALFTLTLFRRGMIIHDSIYFDVATIVQYDVGTAFMARSQANFGAQPALSTDSI